ILFSPLVAIPLVLLAASFCASIEATSTIGMAPRERHHSDPKQSLVQSAATDIVEGFYDAAEAFQTSSPLHQPHPTNGGQHPNSPEDKVAKEKLRRQLEEAKTASKESQIHSELQNSVDSCLRQRGELSDTESIVDDVEFEYSRIDGRQDKCRVARSATVAEMKALVNQRSGQREAGLLLNGAAVSNDQQTVYHLCTRQNFARRGRTYTLQQVGRCGSG
ncbi:hypothetical protein BOX15_Mlig019373g1, partial [Macrostomum lignano]